MSSIKYLAHAGCFLFDMGLFLVGYIFRLIFKMKKLILFYTFLVAALVLQPLYARPGFGPWNADIATGDENVQWHHEESRHPGYGHHDGNSVYNGMQGGALALIRFFQIVISPQDGPSCRYRPVCSAYGRQAVERHGALLGALMAGERILRCNPYNQPGDDPVPGSLCGK